LLGEPAAGVVGAEHVDTTGDASLSIDADGALRLAGKRLTVDVAAVMRVLSAKVELP
jgi:hypothetical protein